MAAVVGILQFTILIRGAHSLKEKRRVVRSIKDHFGHHFNISIAEVEDQDMLNRAVFCIAMAGSDSKYVDAALRKILDQLRVHRGAELLDHTLELL
ncbi:MAG: DUF503 domain-containing protein [Planctomycetota bacterium]